jgi:hypothetical protein
LIGVYETFVTYPEKAAPGISGAPIIMKDPLDGKPKVIGLHQCAISTYSRAVLLTDFGKTPM